ncbi:MAG: flagellar basal-body rod protein FlgG [Verrucomicrobiota bacterium]|jgi:flagellar basal-body rod protein FlgG
MLRALYSAAAGMQSQQTNLDVISNNLANVNTTGFKKTKTEFEDLLYQTTRSPGADQGSGNQLPTGIQIGHGSRLVATSRIFTNGELTQTGERLDVAINGDGFLEVQMPDGTNAYTRAGSLKTTSAGAITTSDGLPVLSGFQAVPSGTTNITISPAGNVTYSTPSGNTNFTVQLTRFNNPNGLESMGRNLFKETQASGSPQLGAPGANGFGELSQGSLELSNVKVVEEMVNLILAQRAYEVNSKAVQAADEMLQAGNNLKRG